MHTVGHGVLGKKLKIMENEKHALQDLEYREKNTEKLKKFELHSVRLG